MAHRLRASVTLEAEFFSGEATKHRRELYERLLADRVARAVAFVPLSMWRVTGVNVKGVSMSEPRMPEWLKMEVP